MKLKLYMSEKCPDCVDAIESLKNANIDYEEINITDSMKNLKEFFTYRDNRKEFESIVKDNKVGVPMITDGEKIVFFEKLEDLRVFDED